MSRSEAASPADPQPAPPVPSTPGCPDPDPSARWRLLGPDDPSPVWRESHGQRFPAVVACDHASRAVPRALGTLGLSAVQASRHIAWDIGAGALARALARRLGVAVVATGFSRLVIDCNRHLDDPTSIVVASDGDAVPGNVGLDEAARAARTREIFEPYHAALEAELEAVVATSGAARPALIAIHSFTDVFGGQARPWHCGVLWDLDPRLAVPLIAALRAVPGLVVGDNEPYSGRHPSDYTIETHAERHGRPHVCIEVRQDLLADDVGVAAWAERLGQPLERLLSDATLYRDPVAAAGRGP